MSDDAWWELLDGITLPPAATAGRNPLDWPGYAPRGAVRFGEGRVAGHDIVACVWTFATYGGSFGEAEADAFVAAVNRAIELRRPLVTFVRTGGTRLQEGMVALVGIPRATLALADLAAAGLAHVALAGAPTTGGVWVAVVSGADLRAGVAGATVGFSGPRVIEAMTGDVVGPSSHTAESAYAAGLLDAVVDERSAAAWIGRALTAVAPHGAIPVTAPAPGDAPASRGWDQVVRSRTASRPDGAALIDVLLDGAVDLAGGDDSVRAVIGRSAAGRRTVGIALAARRGGRPTPAGYRLARRALELADRIDADVVSLVDTPGADPGPSSEAAGVAPAIADAMTALLACRSATVAVVHGEGGSGGALAAATADVVVVTPAAYFAPLAPEGAAVTLRTTAKEAADAMRVTPADLVDVGFADAVADSDPQALRALVATRLAELAARERGARLRARRARWAARLGGKPDA